MFDSDGLLNNKNYKKWRNEHTKMFGEIFSLAFSDNPEAQITLTAALINISGRNFSTALPKLNMLESICVSDFDAAVVSYFLGLDYELLGDEARMNEYYEKMQGYNHSFIFPIAFHPYYRTAKFAQRDSECSKSVYYYRKALAIYDGRELTDKIRSGSSQIIYDIATLYLYMHKYDECERFLCLSEEYDPSENQHRNYVEAILHAVQNKFSESYSLAEGLNRFYREYLDPMLEAIENGRDLHYCICLQDKSGYDEFWIWLTQSKDKLEQLVKTESSEAEKIISEKITALFPFMKRKLDCRLEYNDGAVTLYLKNYSTKTLKFEHEALVAKKPEALSNWTPISVNWFENYELS